MRLKVFFITMFLFKSIVNAQTYYPKGYYSEVSYCEILKIENSTDKTIVYFKYTAPNKYKNGGWVCAGKEFYIRDSDSKIKYKLLKANNIPLCKDKHWFDYKGQVLLFNLEFEKIPNYLKKIDIIESETNGGFNFFQVNLIDERINSNKKGNKSQLSSETEFKAYFLENILKLDPIEGIYLASYDFSSRNYYYDRVLYEKNCSNCAKIAIIKNDGVFNVIYIVPYEYDPYNYETSGIELTRLTNYEFAKTASDYFYSGKIMYKIDDSFSSFDASLNFPYLSFEYKVPKSIVAIKNSKNSHEYINEIVNQKWLKTYPDREAIENTLKKETKPEKNSGTGIAISSKGYVITNYHVVEGAKNIILKGVNGEFSVLYNARLIVYDKSNDLALLKIDNVDFGSIPFSISYRTIDVGTSVFVLGYPLRATMGDEVKLTNGIISSKTGFENDITSYQITAPAQPGNSGGPLFDINGNLIGIIKAKHINAENATYAIKSNYIYNLLDLLPSNIDLPDNKLLNGMSLIEQVKILKKYTYIIEVEY